MYGRADPREAGSYLNRADLLSAAALRLNSTVQTEIAKREQAQDRGRRPSAFECCGLCVAVICKKKESMIRLVSAIHRQACVMATNTRKGQQPIRGHKSTNVCGLNSAACSARSRERDLEARQMTDG